MGVAGLFGFLRRRYPLIVEPCAQQPDDSAAPDSSECDALYLDLNHIIHACTHASYRDTPYESELEQLLELEAYLSRLVGIMR